MVMATPDSVRMAHPPAHAPCYPNSPFRIPATPQATRSRASHDGRGDALLGSPFSVTRVGYTYTTTHGAGSDTHGAYTAGRREHGRQDSMASISDRYPNTNITPSYSSTLNRHGQSASLSMGDQESLVDINPLALVDADTPSRNRESNRHSTSGSSCSGSGTSSASLLSLGRSSEEHRRYSVAVWDDSDASGRVGEALERGGGTGMDMGMGMFGTIEVERGAMENELDMAKNASMVTISAIPRPYHRHRSSSRTASPASPSAGIASTAASPIHPAVTPTGAMTTTTAHTTSAPPTSTKSTPARRKSPFHFIPRLIPAYRRRTRAPSGSGGSEGIAGAGENAKGGTEGGEGSRSGLDGGAIEDKGLAVTVHDQISPATDVHFAFPTKAFQASRFDSSNDNSSAGLGIGIGISGNGHHSSTLSQRAGPVGLAAPLMARTPSSPSSSLLTRAPARFAGFSLTHSFDDEEDGMDMPPPSPSKPPTGHRPGNPRRSTATGTNSNTGSMLAPSAFHLSPGPRGNATGSKMPPGSGSSTISNDSATSTSSSSRPSFRRGITAPGAFGLRSLQQSDAPSTAQKSQFATPPPLFNDIRPSPAAFASTGLIKKKSGMRGPGMGMGMGLGAGGAGGVEGMYSPVPAPRADRGLGFDRFARLALRAGMGGDKGRGCGGEVGTDVSAGVKAGPSRCVGHKRGPSGIRLEPQGSPLSNSASASTSTTSSNPSSNSNNHATSQIPPGRGLRRKGSTMFGSSGSISISSMASVLGISGTSGAGPSGTGQGGVTGVGGGNIGKGRNRSGSAMSSELYAGGYLMGGGARSPVTPTKGAFTLAPAYNTITPPPHRPTAISYPFAFARRRSNATPATVAETETEVDHHGDSSPCAASSPVVRTMPSHARAKVHCLGASTSTTASTSTGTGTDSGHSSPLRARARATGDGEGEGGSDAGVGGAKPRQPAFRRPGPLVRASNPMLGATYRQHGELSEVRDEADDEEATDVEDVEDRLDSAPCRNGLGADGSTGRRAAEGLAFQAKNTRRLTVRTAATAAAATATSSSESSTSMRYSAATGDIKRNRLDTDFVLVQGIGAGEFSQVWKVRSRKDGRVSAVKAGKAYTGVKNRLWQLEEISILHSLRSASYPLSGPISDSTTPYHQSQPQHQYQVHPHILPFLSAWEHKSRLYIQTALLPLGDLARFLEACGDTAGLGEVRTWKLLVELTDALRFIHAQGVVHLDIKPGNVFIEQGGSVRVGDFGMAARLKRAPNAIAAGQNDGVQVREGQKRNEWGCTGLETSLGEPPLVGGDGTFYWPTNNHATTHALSPDSAKQNGQEQQRQHSPQYISPSPMLERDVEGDREYLSPEALSDDAVHRVGTHSDVYSLGVMLLEAAGNVALPSNGDGWHRLRNDDYSDLAECFLPRAKHTICPSTGTILSTLDKRQGTDSNLPVLSDELLDVIKGLTRSDPAERTTLNEVWDMDMIKRVRGLMRGDPERRRTVGEDEEKEEEEGKEGENVRRREKGGTVRCGALVEEDEDAVALLFP